MTDSALLEQLFSGGEPAQQAWKQFLLRYSNLFLKIIWQFEKDRDVVMERYLFICSKLVADDCSMLRKFHPEVRQRPPKLSTWLTVVVKNLCVEAYRKEHGRQRFPRALLGMTPLDRQIFKLYYWEGLSWEEIRQTLSANGHRNSRLDSSLVNIRSLITRVTPSRAAKTITILDSDGISNFAGDEHDDELSVMKEFLVTSLESLTTRERAIVRLRFWQNLSAREIAEALHIAPPRRVYTILEQVLKKLRTKALQELTK